MAGERVATEFQYAITPDQLQLAELKRLDCKLPSTQDRSQCSSCQEYCTARFSL